MRHQSAISCPTPPLHHSRCQSRFGLSLRGRHLCLIGAWRQQLGQSCALIGRSVALADLMRYSADSCACSMSHGNDQMSVGCTPHGNCADDACGHTLPAKPRGQQHRTRSEIKWCARASWRAVANMHIPAQMWPVLSQRWLTRTDVAASVSARMGRAAYA